VKRAGRRIFGIVAYGAIALSLAVWPLTLVLWLYRPNHVLTVSADGLSDVQSFRGAIHVTRRSRPGPDAVDPLSPTWRAWRFMGFGGESFVRPDGANVTVRTFHVWPITALNLVVIGMWVGRYRRARRSADRVARRMCPGCGYDCRATPERCPECGRLVGRAVEVSSDCRRVRASEDSVR
jgi:hypothetical protein